MPKVYLRLMESEAKIICQEKYRMVCEVCCQRAFELHNLVIVFIVIVCRKKKPLIKGLYCHLRLINLLMR